MKKQIVLLMCVFFIGSSLLAGCKRIRAYDEDRARVDQDLETGNRGYFSGEKPNIDDSERRLTRKVYTVEVDLPPYYEKEKAELDKRIEENRNKKAEAVEYKEEEFIMPEPETEPMQEEIIEYTPSAEVQEIELDKDNYTEYVVSKDDTLQKISQKFFGTTKKWFQLYEYNKDVLSGPDKIYPGQKIKIPKL